MSDRAKNKTKRARKDACRHKTYHRIMSSDSDQWLCMDCGAPEEVSKDGATLDDVVTRLDKIVELLERMAAR